MTALYIYSVIKWHLHIHSPQHAAAASGTTADCSSPSHALLQLGHFGFTILLPSGLPPAAAAGMALAVLL